MQAIPTVPNDGVEDDRSEDYTSDTEEKQKRLFGNFINGTEMTFNLLKLTPREASEQHPATQDDQTFFRELSLLREMKTKRINLSDCSQELAVMDAHKSDLTSQQNFVIPTEYSGASFAENCFPQSDHLANAPSFQIFHGGCVDDYNVGSSAFEQFACPEFGQSTYVPTEAQWILDQWPASVSADIPQKTQINSKYTVSLDQIVNGID